MTKKITIILVILINGLFCFGQKHGFFKYDWGITIDQIQFDSNTDNFKFFDYINTSFSLTYEHRINDFLSIETGAQDRSTMTGIVGYIPDTFSVGHVSRYTTIPLRIILNQKIIGNLNLLQRFGTNFSVRDRYFFYDFAMESNSIKVNINLPKTYFTFDLGVGLGWIFSKTKSWKLTLMYDYNISPKTILDVDLQDSNSVNYAHFKSSGNYQTFMLGIGYRISDFWIKNNAPTAN